MTRPGNAIVTEVAITTLPPAQLHALEVWCDPHGVSARIAAAFGSGLPATGCSVQAGALTLIRYEPTVWLVEGDAAALEPLLGGDGALTAIGGGIVRVRLSGPGWRDLLSYGGQFDAFAPAFGVGRSAATVIDHVGVRLWVESADACIAYVPASFASALVHFWEEMAVLVRA